jgi:hypothetical protein
MAITKPIRVPPHDRGNAEVGLFEVGKVPPDQRCRIERDLPIIRAIGQGAAEDDARRLNYVTAKIISPTARF